MRPDADPRVVIDDLLELYAIDALDRAETAAFEAALGSVDDSDRVAAVRDVRRTRDAVARMAAEHVVAPGDAVRRSLLDAVAEDATQRSLRSVPVGDASVSQDMPALAAPGQDPAGARTSVGDTDELAARRTRRRRIAMSVTSAAAALLLVIGGVVIGRSTTSSPQPSTPTVAQGAAGLDEMRTVMSAQDATIHRTKMTGMAGTVVVASSRTLDTAVVLLDQAPVPPDQRVFQLWLIGNNHAPRSAGLITTASVSDPVVVTGLGDSRTVGMTVEPTGGSPEPTGDVLAAVTL